MKKTKNLCDKLIRLAEGEALPASCLKGEWFSQMCEDGVLTTVRHGSRKSLRVIDLQTFKSYLADNYEIPDLEALRSLLSAGSPDRSLQVAVTGDSKFVRRRTFCGFLVNSYHPIPAILSGEQITIMPPDGSFMFIYDYERFKVPRDIVVVGIENPENFRHIAAQRRLFDETLGTDVKLLFVSRYPQGQSKDLIKWLMRIKNKYVHWGDLDLAGVNIFLTEFHKYLNERASMLVPADFECRIARGSRARYDDQYGKFGKLVATDPRLKQLIDCIHKCRRGYDQEGYIRMPMM